MAKRSYLKLSAYQSIETSKDWNGRYFIAYSNGASVFIRDLKELRKFLKIPKSIAMREKLDAWLEELEEADKQKTTLTVVEGLSEELKATGFGPEVHSLDESDPNYQTRMVV